MKAYATKISEENGKRLMKKIQMEKREDVERMFTFDENSSLRNNCTQATTASQIQMINSLEYEDAKNRWITKCESYDNNSGFDYNFYDKEVNIDLFKSTLELISLSTMDRQKGIDDNSSSSIESNITNEVNGNDYNIRLVHYSNSIRFNQILASDNSNSDNGMMKMINSLKAQRQSDTKTTMPSPNELPNQKSQKLNPLSRAQQTSFSYEMNYSSTEENDKRKNTKKEAKDRNSSNQKACRNKSKEKESERMQNETDSIDDISIRSFNTDSIVDIEESFDEL